jgi:type I restriction enzyme, S subunit
MRQLLVKNDEFKDSPVGKIPKDWDVISIEQLAIYVGSGITPRGGSNVYKKEGILFIRSQNVTFGGLLLDDVAYIDTRIHDSMKRSEVFPYDVLINITGASIGRCCPVPKELGIANVNQHVCAIRLPNPNLKDAIFLSSVLASHIGQSQIDRLNAGGNREGLNYQQLRSFIIPFPTLEERACIAEILDTTDRAIAQTSALITKLKQTKAGLLQDLLTRGLDENGQLRNPQTHPEQFKESAIGLIPKEWDIFKLLEVVPRAEYGISVSLDDEVGTPVLRMNNLKDGEVELTDLKKSASIEAANLLLKPFDILFNRTNSIEHVGRTGIWRGQIEQASFASYLVRLIPEQSKLIPEYLNIWLNLQRTQLVIRRYATPGVHQVNINPTNLRKVLIILPQKISEQEAVVKIVDSHDTRIRKEEAYLNKLKLQKQGLMQDLLTGKVRVKPNT